MKHSKLHEIAKLASGLALGDFLALWMISSYGLLPFDFLGLHITQTIVVPGLIFDAAIFLFLIHYGWRIGTIPAVREYNYLLIAGTIFGFVAIAHILRLYTALPIDIIGWMVPLWLSWIAVIVSAYLSYMSFHVVLTMKK